MRREQVRGLLLRAKLGFVPVMGRLKAALGVPTDLALAQLLGMSSGNYANRKRTDSIPFEIVIPLCLSRAVSLDWLFSGVGEVYTNGRAAQFQNLGLVDAELMGKIAAEVWLAEPFSEAGPNDAARVRYIENAILQALIYNEAVSEQDEKARREKIRTQARWLVEIRRLQPRPAARAEP